MLYCKDIKCETCEVSALCTHIPAHTEHDLEEIKAKVGELKHMADMMNVDPRTLMEALNG